MIIKKFVILLKTKMSKRSLNTNWHGDQANKAESILNGMLYSFSLSPTVWREFCAYRFETQNVSCSNPSGETFYLSNLCGDRKDFSVGQLDRWKEYNMRFETIFFRPDALGRRTKKLFNTAFRCIQLFYSLNTIFSKWRLWN